MSFYNRCFALPKKTLSIVKETKNEAVIQLKKNQKTLFNLAMFITENNTPLSSFTQKDDKGHGRIDSRKTEVFEIPETAKSLDKEWNNISCIAKTYRTRNVLDTKKKDYKNPKVSISYYISTKTFEAKTLANIIQGHWGIENKVNYVKDVQFREDKSRIRVKPGIFARLRSLTLNILRLNNVENISEARHLNCLNINYALYYTGIT